MSEDIGVLHKEKFQELLETYGDYYQIPKDEIHVWQETTRARYVLASYPDGGATVLKQHGIPMSVITRITDEDINSERRIRRADKYKAMNEWCKANVAVQVTPDELAEIGDVSRVTALKFIQDRVDLFRKVKRGLYEVRDRDTERAVEK